MKKFLWMMAATLFCGSLTVMGQKAEDQFSIATLNVDGLPQKILVVKVNADGPGDAGTARIGKYLSRKGYDLVMMQEDFNYHGVLTVFLEDDYAFDEWSGNVEVEGHKIDYLHLQNHRFECDGLMACWKNDLTVTPEGRTAWKQAFGKFSHANDDLITKGFRRYDVTLRNGAHVLVYNMHMDASDDEDEAAENDAKDKEARMAQWAQLKEDVLQQLATSPIIIVGDMNSFYGRDNVKQDFIDAINATGRGTVSDVWVELQQNGSYPSVRDEGVEAGETLDKILYINPVLGTHVVPVAFSVDKDGYQYNDQPLGDHYPVAATFKVSVNTATGMEATPSDNETTNDSFIYNLNGQRVSQPQRGIYITNGNKTVIR